MVLKRYCSLFPRGFGPFGKHQEIEGKATTVHSGNSLLINGQKPLLYLYACAQSNKNQYFLQLLSQGNKIVLI